MRIRYKTAIIYAAITLAAVVALVYVLLLQ